MRQTNETCLGIFKHALRAIALGAICAAVWCNGSTAFAQKSVTVLGVRSIEGDDAFANGLSTAIRLEAAKTQRWRVSERAVSITQMGLAYGCEEPDVKCLTEIAAGIGSDQLVYGTIRRTGAGEKYRFLVIVSLFDGETRAIENTVVEPSVAADLEVEALGAVAEKLVGKLIQRPSEAKNGSMVLQTNVMDARVSLDGHFVGVAKEGELKVREVSPGTHKVQISQSGYETYRGEVQIPEGDQVTLSASLVALDGSQPEKEQPAKSDGQPASLSWLGYTLIGVSVASVAAMATSWIVIKNVDDDPLFEEYRRRVGENSTDVEVADVCQQAKAGNDYASPGQAPFGRVSEINMMCRRASLFEVLQYVFLGTALASGAAGTYILIKEANRPERSPENSQATSKLTLWPTFSGNGGRITAKVTF